MALMATQLQGSVLSDISAAHSRLDKSKVEESQQWHVWNGHIHSQESITKCKEAYYLKY